MVLLIFIVPVHRDFLAFSLCPRSHVIPNRGIMSKSVASFESTKLPDSEMASQAEKNDSDMETNFSKRSKSTPFNRRSIGAQAKHIRRAMISQGMNEEFVLGMTDEEVISHRDAKRLEQSTSSSLTEERMSAYHNQLAKNVDPVAEMFDFNAVDYIAKNNNNRILPDEVQKVHKMCISDGMCHLCSKGCYGDPSDTHLTSAAHLEKVNEQALCNRLFGESSLFRRLSSQGCRFKTKTAMRTYWGSQVENLGHLARRLVYEEGRVIFYKYGKSNAAKAYTITKDQKPIFHLAALRYDRESGKYARQKYHLQDVELWHNMDELDGGDMPQAPQDQVLGNGDGNGTGSNEDNYANGTWWPVLLCQLPCDAPGPFQTMVPGYVYVIICFYQVLDTPLWAWTIEFWWGCYWL